ncbi:hypothetical protein SESBI_21364 [Sesbania bispinosa]|nr:hypothetical protein SESBI_21364 [Sesbania bispinosa]
MSYHNPTSDSFKEAVMEAMASSRGGGGEGKTRETPKTPPDRSQGLGRKSTYHNTRKTTSVSPNHKRVLSGQQILEQINGVDLKSMRLKAEEKLSNRPKKGEIYDEVSANLKSIERRLKNLSMNRHTFSIDEAIEISDAATLLRLLRKPEHEIELAGQLAHSGALLMLQADMLTKKARELLSQSKTKLQSADL